MITKKKQNDNEKDKKQFSGLSKIRKKRRVDEKKQNELKDLGGFRKKKLKIQFYFIPFLLRQRESEKICSFICFFFLFPSRQNVFVLQIVFFLCLTCYTS